MKHDHLKASDRLSLPLQRLREHNAVFRFTLVELVIVAVVSFLAGVVVWL